MFAMFYGRWPGVDVGGAVRAQVDAGFDVVTDGLTRWPDAAAALADAIAAGDTGADGMVVRAWRETAAVPESAGVTIAATVVGPYTLARRASLEPLAVAEILRREFEALASAGCALVVVDEPDAVGIGGDPDARRRFRDAHAALLGDAPPLHAMLAITGGPAWEAGAETILDAPYASYLFDLVAGPDNWHLVRAAPGDRGIVCAGLRAPSTADQAPLLVWAARYAASMSGRGLARVGLANASPLGGLSVEDATRALASLARAARLASMTPEEAIAAGLDRRTFAQPPGRGERPRLPRSANSPRSADE
jgi:hypothetical protein